MSVRSLRWAIVAATAVVACGACGGGGSGDNGSGGPAATGCTNGKYVLDTGITAAVCKSFVGALAGTQTDTTNAPAFVTPLAGAVLSGSGTAPTFKWTAGHTDPPDAGASTDAAGGDDGGSTPAVAYMLVFRDASGAEVLRVLTPNVSWQPDDNSWSTLSGVSSPAGDGGGDASAQPELDTTLVGAAFAGTVAGTPLAGQTRTFYVGS